MIVGVSPDSVRKHANFKRRFKLPFTLVADVDHVVGTAYGVSTWKKLFGHRYRTFERTTFLIDATGRIRKVWEDPNVLVHAAEVQQALERLRRPGPAEG